MPRVAGHRGRRPVKAPAERFALRYVHEYLSEPLPAPRYPVDVTGGIPADGWLMLGNGPDPTCTTHPQGVGDCGFAGRQHYRMAKAACEGAPMPTETSNQLVAEYLAYDHGQDVGVQLAEVLLTWYKAGKILAFAPVDHTDPAACDSAMQQFRGLYCGVDLTDDADDLFQMGQPWTLANGEMPDPSEGHCIVKVRANGHSLDEYVTWGALQAATRGWSAACLREAWAVITSEDEVNPAALAAMRADIDALHGTGGGPAPAPQPSPEPALLAELARLARELVALLERIGL